MKPQVDEKNYSHVLRTKRDISVLLLAVQDKKGGGNILRQGNVMLVEAAFSCSSGVIVFLPYKTTPQKCYDFQRNPCSNACSL